MASDQELRLPCGVKDCGVWFTSDEAHAAHHALVHDPDDVPVPEAVEAAAPPKRPPAKRPPHSTK